MTTTLEPRTLAAATPIKELLTVGTMREGRALIFDTHTVDASNDGRCTRIRVSLAGVPHKRAASGAIAHLYHPTGDPTSWRDMRGKVTYLIYDGGNITVWQGTATDHGLQQKGNPRRSWPWTQFEDRISHGERQMLDVLPGYVKPEAFLPHLHAAADHIPDVAPIPLDSPVDGIPVEDDHDDKITAAFLIEQSVAGFTARGAVFAITHQQPDPKWPKDTILNGYLWADGECGLTAEHGSITLGQLCEAGGRITNLAPNLTMQDMFDLPGDPATAYQRITN